MLLSQIIAAGAGFLISVLWFDLMFDVQVLRHRREPDVPKTVLDSISAYYHRVTETASPMGRLVGLVMLALLVAFIVQAARGDVPAWVSAVSIAAALVGFGLAGLRVFGRARRLGRRTDAVDMRSAAAAVSAERRSLSAGDVGVSPTHIPGGRAGRTTSLVPRRWSDGCALLYK